ncbi:MAG: serine/threonine-protein phosphatase [Desulfofustis sp.]|nr:serine/threonine-protein phosphatase [Desulfofustis sp.]
MTRTHEGRINQMNEDRLLVRKLPDGKTLLLAADGLGGHPGGHVAASLVSQYFSDQPADRLVGSLVDLLVESSSVISRHGAAHPAIDGMGSTATAVLLDSINIEWAHVGDCRLYHLSDKSLKSITRDQTLAQQMYERGDISSEELTHHRLGHMLEQCLGEDDIEPDSGTLTWKPGDFLLLCTDGLYNMVKDEGIHDTLSRSTRLDQMADQLMELALKAGGKDNISFILGCNVEHK